MYAEVIINTNVKSLNKIFDYVVPKDMEKKIKIGARVYVPFGMGSKIEDGFVVNLKKESAYTKDLKEIARVESTDILSDDRINLAKLMARKYFCNISDCMRLMLQPGTKASNFEGLDENGNSVKLSDFKGKKLVLYFYPKDSTPGCTAEACDLRDNYQRFLSLGYEIVGVSRDSAASHQRFIAKYNLPFRLIADTDLTILKAYEAWGEKKMYGKVTEGTLRTTYVIDEQGVIIDAIAKVETRNHSAQLLGE